MSKRLALIAASFLSLFLELSLIRWMPAHVFSVAFFSNVILIASFLGLGLGLLLSEREGDSFHIFPWILGAGVCIILYSRHIRVLLPSDAETWIWSSYEGNRLCMPSWKIPITGILGFIFGITIFIFIPIGQKIGKLMNEFSPLKGYTLNIFGSLCGVVCFGILSFLRTPAYVWFLAAGLIVIALFYKKRGFSLILCLITALVLLVGMAERKILWSPYYSIELKKTEESGTALYVNQLFHQKAVNFEKEPYALEKFMLPYRWFSPERLLVVGAGMGNDVWAARKAGVKHIDAVEIDPVIIDLGKKGHPQRPFDSDDIRTFINDARSFMHRIQGPYDMIIYGTLDSHATLSVTSSIRLDNYVYTREALEEARRALSPDGVIVLLFSVPTQWMGARLLETVGSIFGEDEVRYVLLDPYLFNLVIFAGPGLRNALLSEPDMANVLSSVPSNPGIEIPKDDWPYLYLEKRGIPRIYVVSLIILVCISLIMVFAFTPLKRGKIDIFFLSLGCGFLLLETKSVTTLSLLFGSTWIVNAVVFLSILSLALLANWLVMSRKLQNPADYFIGLIASLIVSYFFDLHGLLTLNFLIKIFTAGLLAGLPIFFAAVIFAIVFSRTKNAGMSLGSNLLGAVMGGFLEYSSMVWGLNALYMVALFWYLIAGISLRKNR